MCERCGCVITASEAERAVETPLHANGHANGHGNQHHTEHPHVDQEHATQSVSVLTDLLAKNDRVAAHNREHFDQHAVLALNLMSSPGAGKTSLLERTIEELGGRLSIAVIEGDLATENDAQRIRARGVPAVQITTGSACHLDAPMVHRALHGLTLAGLDVLFIENVGNLVCPASFDLGQHLNVTLLSVPEGDDKPQKYPVIFRAADLVLLTKCDLLPLLPEFNAQRAAGSLRALGTGTPLLQVSSRSSDGIQAWCDWLLQQLDFRRGLRAAGAAAPLLEPAVQSSKNAPQAVTGHGG